MWKSVLTSQKRKKENERDKTTKSKVTKLNIESDIEETVKWCSYEQHEGETSETWKEKLRKSERIKLDWVFSSLEKLLWKTMKLSNNWKAKRAQWVTTKLKKGWKIKGIEMM